MISQHFSNQNPGWDWATELNVDNPSLAGHILLEVFDDDVGKDDLLGVVAIPTADILRGKTMTRQRQFNIHNGIK